MLHQDTHNLPQRSEKKTRPAGWALGDDPVAIGFAQSGCFEPETARREPSGKHTKSYWKWPFIVSFPIKNGDFQ